MVELKKFATKESAAKDVAEHIVNLINKFNPNADKPFVMGLPTGSSPEPVYKELVSLYKSGKVSFQNVVTFNMDEYCGLDANHEQSYRYFMDHHLFNHIDIKPENINILNGMAEDKKAECGAYEKKIAKFAPFQVFMGGIGPEGHIAFNERGSARNSLTREIQLEESTIIANSRFFNGDMSKVPKTALTVGISTVLDNSKELIILVFGENKREILHKTLTAPISSDIPSTFIREHDNAIIYCDNDASKDL
ncbi:hypothetical protein CANINC_000082 [Pichia inconspicua]|uniref:glucosamine-6-phosphate deaminase n=1 Tax=Pichia inconspicua TaxID=52247 RepID=A0A4T0X758_9ASCO|nr:hypothetical protein CANINC_000082 [[Candida] inconspicua]